MRLFIADTNDRVRERLASIAASVEGMTVVGEAGDVGSAIRGIKRARPDSVIVALPLSGGSGLDVLAAAKSTNPDSVAIMMTSGPCAECRHKCLTMGADYFFEKSGDMKKIVTTLVLLAHEPEMAPSELEPEEEQRRTRFHRGPATQFDSIQFSIPAACPRIATSQSPKGELCFLVGGGSQHHFYARH